MSDAPGLFSVRMVAAVVVAGALSFLAFLWLTAYSPELRGGDDGGAHALSKSAVGFRALGDLLGDTGSRVVRQRKRMPTRGGLLVLTPTPTTDPKLLAKMVGERRAGRTLIILPKWATQPLRTGRAGWVTSAGTIGRSAPVLLSELVQISSASGGNKRPGVVRSAMLGEFPLPVRVQTISGPAIEPLVISTGGGALVARIRARPHVFIIADPDLLNTMGLKDPATARAAVELFNYLRGGDWFVTFDLTLNGFEASSNLLKLAFEPPFVAATLCLLIAAALAALGAFFPFGPAIREARAIGFGKRALVDNSADLVIGARRETLVAARYAELTRDMAATRLGLSQALSPEDVIENLDRLGTSDGKPFAILTAQLQAARGRSAIASAAAAMHKWKKERLA